MNTRYKKMARVTLESLLLQHVAKQKIRENVAGLWKMEHRAVLQEFNRIADEHGLLSDEYCVF